MNEIYKNIFLYGLNATYILYFVALFGISSYAPRYLEYFRSFLKYYVAIILIILYNPITYKQRQFSKFDRSLVFSSAVFLLFSTTFIASIEASLREQSKMLIQNAVELF